MIQHVEKSAQQDVLASLKVDARAALSAALSAGPQARSEAHPHWPVALPPCLRTGHWRLQLRADLHWP